MLCGLSPRDKRRFNSVGTFSVVTYTNSSQILAYRKTGRGGAGGRGGSQRIVCSVFVCSLGPCGKTFNDPDPVSHAQLIDNDIITAALGFVTSSVFVPRTSTADSVQEVFSFVSGVYRSTQRQARVYHRARVADNFGFLVIAFVRK